MFLHKKSQSGPVKRLKSVVKLDFAGSGEDLRGCYNVEKRGNRLISRFRHKEIRLFSDAWQTVVTNGDWVFLVTDEGVYCLNNGVLIWLVEGDFPSVAGCVYRGDVIVSAKEMGTYFVTNDKEQKVYEKGFSSMTVCADRVFGLYQNEVSYTAAGERDGWEQGETVTLPTPCQALVAVDGKVYALGDTCYTLSPKADDVEFKFGIFAKHVGAAASRSVVNYNGRAVFATSTGLYEICLNKITPIFTQLSDVVDFSACAGTVYDGKYYLSCRCKDGVGSSNDVTLVLDLDEEKVVGVLDEGYNSICATNSKIYAVNDGHLYWFWQASDPARYVKSKIDFGVDGKKFLDKLKVKTLNDLEVVIRSEKETRLYKLKGKKMAQNLNLRGMGWEFSIELSCQDGLDVENLELFAHTCEEV